MSSTQNSPDKDRPYAVLVGVQLPDVSDLEHKSSLDELSRLVQTLGFRVLATVSQKRKSLAAGSAIGAGKLTDIAEWTGGTGRIEGYSKRTSSLEPGGEGEVTEDLNVEEDIEVIATGGAPSGAKKKAKYVVFDNELSPTQSRNLESALGVEVMDRTGVIVEIFHRHAKTPAAKAQVEIARLTYLTPRIRAKGPGERQGGGIGAKGAGETQHELDRRKIRDRIAELRRLIEGIHRDEALRRERRRDQRKIALVGYTNAGKSSLMRALTGSEVLVADKLFATLDTTVRAIHPETKPKILVTDTVGFIKKLPHDLVASFRSTLDEALDATLLLYVVDASDPNFRTQLNTTKAVLADIGATDMESMLIMNKADRLSELEKSALKREFPEVIFCSAISAESVRELRNICIKHFEHMMIEKTIEIPHNKQAAVAEIHRSMRVLSETHDESGTTIKFRGFASDIDRLVKTHKLQ